MRTFHAMREFDTGREVERERLRVLLQTRQDMLRAGKGSPARIDELDKVIAMLNPAP